MSFSDDVISNRGKLFKFALRLSRQKEAAEDLVQETMLKALKYKTSFQKGSNLEAWLYTILRNTHISLMRRRHHKMGPLPNNEGYVLPQMITPASQEHAAYLSQVMESIAALPRNSQETFNLVRLQDESYEDAAIATGVAQGTIKSRVNRAVEYLQKRLGELDYTSDSRKKHKPKRRKMCSDIRDLDATPDSSGLANEDAERVYSKAEVAAFARKLVADASPARERKKRVAPVIAMSYPVSRERPIAVAITSRVVQVQTTQFIPSVCTIVMKGVRIRSTVILRR